MIGILLLSVVFLCLCLFFQPKWLFLLISIALAGYYFGMPEGNLLIFIIYLLGILMLIIELYIPDFGLVGIFGFITIVLALHLHLHDPSQLVLTILAIILTGLLAIVIPLRFGKTLNIGPGFVLDTSLNRDHGYTSSKDYSYLIGKNGIVTSPLRPVGRAKFEEEYYEVISSEDFISQGTSIYVDRVEGSHIYVRKGGI